MQPCNLTIITSIDGEESVFSTDGEMELSPQSASICYTQEDSSVHILIKNARISIERTGGYVLRLDLEKNKAIGGVVGLPGAEGRIEATAHKIGYTVKEKSLLLSAKYTLRFDSGAQDMSIRLIARGK